MSSGCGWRFPPCRERRHAAVGELALAALLAAGAGACGATTPLDSGQKCAAGVDAGRGTDVQVLVPYQAARVTFRCATVTLKDIVGGCQDPKGTAVHVKPCSGASFEVTPPVTGRLTSFVVEIGGKSERIRVDPSAALPENVRDTPNAAQFVRMWIRLALDARDGSCRGIATGLTYPNYDGGDALMLSPFSFEPCGPFR